MGFVKDFETGFLGMLYLRSGVGGFVLALVDREDVDENEGMEHMLVPDEKELNFLDGEYGTGEL